MLAVTDVLPAETVLLHDPELGAGVFLVAGDEPARCRASVLVGRASVGPVEGVPAG